MLPACQQTMMMWRRTWQFSVTRRRWRPACATPAHCYRLAPGTWGNPACPPTTCDETLLLHMSVTQSSCPSGRSPIKARVHLRVPDSILTCVWNKLLSHSGQRRPEVQGDGVPVTGHLVPLMAHALLFLCVICTQQQWSGHQAEAQVPMGDLRQGRTVLQIALMVSTEPMVPCCQCHRFIDGSGHWQEIQPLPLWVRAGERPLLLCWYI